MACKPNLIARMHHMPSGRRSIAKYSRLDGAGIAKYMEKCPAQLGDLILEVREVVLETAPNVEEALRFHELCYFKPNQPYGAIGGNVCLIGPHRDHVRLAFIHGASLPDPTGLLRGSGKAKRHIEIHTVADAHRTAVRALIRASLAYSPFAGDK